MAKNYIWDQIEDVESLKQFCNETPDGCWILKSVDPKKDNYVSIRWRGRMTQAHRAVCELRWGKYDPPLLACHKCGNKRCVRPDENHVYLGTALRNVFDTVEHVKGGKQFDHWEANRRRLAVLKQFRMKGLK